MLSTPKERKREVGELTRQKRIPLESSTPSLQRLSQTEHNKSLQDDGSTTSRMSYPSIEEIIVVCAMFQLQCSACSSGAL